MKANDLVDFIACPFQGIIASGRVCSVDISYNACMIELTDDRGQTYKQWVPIPNITKLVRFT